MPRSAKRALADSALVMKTPAQPANLDGKKADDVVHEGWLLKKRRKKMQGYARRYFVLHSSGTLEYSFEPGAATRDQIPLLQAAVSSTPGGRDIHVDSDRVTFHIKCLTQSDFELWMSSLRKFVITGSERKLSRASSAVSKLGNSLNTTESILVLLDDMGNTIQSATDLMLAMDEERKRINQYHHRKKDGNDNHNHRDGSVFSLFKKRSHSPGGHEDSTHFDELALSERMQKTLQKLHNQHRTLKASIANTSFPQTNAGFARHGLSLSSIADELEGAPRTTVMRTPPPSTWHANALPNRMSMSSASSIWYDANDDFGGEEFVLEPDEMGEGETNANSTMNSHNQGSAADMLEEDEVESVIDREPQHPTQIVRRNQLPSRPPGEEGSLFSLLKKSVGQDLANISFPVTFNEPLTLLQRTAEEFEYQDLLNQAAATDDWIQKFAYVAAFAVSGYACTKYRSGRKGFTPMLGETFEDIRVKFISEKVVHKPLLMAFHAEGLGWELTGTSGGKTKFWGKSLEIIPTGYTSLTMGHDKFEWSKPSSFTRNLVMGTKYLEHCGEMIIRNRGTGARCVLNFKETSYWANTTNAVLGTVLDSNGNVVSHLEGKWDEQFSQKLDDSHLRVLWRISPFPRDSVDYYGFTHWGITLNEITNDIKDKLPRTDSRFRSDVRALEEGDIQLAEAEKTRLEEMQRERRESGKQAQPKWFKQVDGSDQWIYKGGYWEERSLGWKSMNNWALW
ncbi:hypothetical protein BD410DRAFT_811646 [Rickenella mellea]|uniref:PH domain-containing protein n=1 Tax=Rickenella mellea TaxID=50990 RepID=A0A4Y7QNW4_9AGAM|nr:hypothetical protein BD410DRAFT_811646 [Rickenella mellea]